MGGYWKPLSDVFLDYINHPEAKFEGEVGILERRHLKPSGCVYIGKEANKIEMQELESNTVEMYHDIEKIREFVIGLTPAEAREIGIKYRSTLKKLKDRVKEEDFNLNTKEMRNILEKCRYDISSYSGSSTLPIKSIQPVLLSSMMNKNG
ncbi:hypothetical protein [Methanolobus sp. ZRKC5]|uniref:hypothetical protein n=1 Tax=unclassified Methanolobus TaxID=2629569 RepID=UPI00313C3B18